MTMTLLGPFLLALLLQLLACLKTRSGFLKALPLVIDLLTFFYANARFWGLISYGGDTAGIYDGGLTDGLSIGMISISGLIGIVLAWFIFYLISRAKARHPQNR